MSTIIVDQSTTTITTTTTTLNAAASHLPLPLPPPCHWAQMMLDIVWARWQGGGGGRGRWEVAASRVVVVVVMVVVDWSTMIVDTSWTCHVCHMMQLVLTDLSVHIMLRSLSIMVTCVSRVSPGLTLTSSISTGNNIFPTYRVIYSDWHRQDRTGFSPSPCELNLIWVNSMDLC